MTEGPKRQLKAQAIFDPWKTIEQLGDDLAQAREQLEQRTISLQVLKAALDSEVEERVSVQIELTDACAARDALAWCEELAAIDEALGEFYCPVLDPKTDEPCGSYWKDHGVNMMRQELNCVRTIAMSRNNELTRVLNERDEAVAEYEAAEVRATELIHECDGLTRECNALNEQLTQAIHLMRDAETEAEGLRRQLEQAEARLERALIECQMAKDGRSYWYEMYHAAEAALADCGSRGIYTKFDDPADAIMQMAARIEKLEHALGERDKILWTEHLEHLERAVRQEAEQDRDHWCSIVKHERAWRCEAQNETIMEGVAYRTKLDKATAQLARARQQLAESERCHKAAQVLARNRSIRLETAETRISDLTQRAEELEQERDKWRGDWESATAELLNTRERLTGVGRRAEALAALVTPELAALLERLASHAQADADKSTNPSALTDLENRDAEAARALAARIREALAQEGNDEG